MNEKLSEYAEAIWQELWPYIASEDPPDSGDSEKDLETVTSGVLPKVWREVLALEARLSKMEDALGDGGDLEYAADLLQTATNDHGVDQSFDNNPYATSDYLRKLAALTGERR